MCEDAGTGVPEQERAERYRLMGLVLCDLMAMEGEGENWILDLSFTFKSRYETLCRVKGVSRTAPVVAFLTLGAYSKLTTEEVFHKIASGELDWKEDKWPSREQTRVLEDRIGPRKRT